MALSEGFFMNSSRRVPSFNAASSNDKGTASYLTVNEGIMVKIDRGNNNCFSINDYYPDWLIYTDITGTSAGGS